MQYKEKTENNIMLFSLSLYSFKTMPSTKIAKNSPHEKLVSGLFVQLISRPGAWLSSWNAHSLPSVGLLIPRSIFPES